ncbi:MAG: phosphate/phosphite/phosphonate ABC transporter substrate-binding protein [Candidatus Cloacimonetes bacterium]|nr:phosphate/phosphite/phosphonate ABC transporter substrate-binding protein [Candidatus Cloacimonadota bacterium]MBS3766765.1 phosphate/phosphite/phosphonate ABC transporter substrate-binding protein [Candidatus Cloacimonadota bacterium]
MKKVKIMLVFILLITFLIINSCGEQGPLGSKSNPIKMYFVPSVEAGKILQDAEQIADMLFEKTGYHFKVAVPVSYAAVIEAMGTDEADIAWLPTFAYLLAHKKYGADVGLTTIRNGLKKYRGQFVTLADSGIESLEDIEGKVIAYTDAASTSGYIFPSATLAKKDIEPAKYFFAGGHPQAIISVYKGNADVGCTFWSPKKDGKIQDARYTIEDTYPDVKEKVKIVGFTDWIPNDTVTFRKEFPKGMKEEIVNALIKIAETERGKKTFQEIYHIDGFYKSTDSTYDVVRETLDALGEKAEKFLQE